MSAACGSGTRRSQQLWRALETTAGRNLVSAPGHRACGAALAAWQYKGGCSPIRLPTATRAPVAVLPWPPGLSCLCFICSTVFRLQFSTLTGFPSRPQTIPRVVTILDSGRPAHQSVYATLTACSAAAAARGERTRMPSEGFRTRVTSSCRAGEESHALLHGGLARSEHVIQHGSRGLYGSRGPARDPST